MDIILKIAKEIDYRKFTSCEGGVNIEKYFEEVDRKGNGLMTFEDFDKLIYDFIGISNMPYHDFRLIRNMYASQERDDYIDYFKFNRDIQKQLISEDGIKDREYGQSMNWSRSPNKTLTASRKPKK